MEAKLRAVLSAGVPGVRVKDLCAELEISRQTFYKYKRRWEAEGPPGWWSDLVDPIAHPG